MFNTKNIVFSIIMGIIFPIVLYLNFVLSFNFMGSRDNGLTAVLAFFGFVVYVIMVFVGHFRIQKSNPDDRFQFLLTFFHAIITFLLGIILSSIFLN